jgi:hypothetical protein
MRSIIPRWFRSFFLASMLLFTTAAIIGAGEWKLVAVDSNHIAIKGYDTVAYFTDGKAVKGSREFEYVFDDARWQFSNAAHRGMFDSTWSRARNISKSGMPNPQKISGKPTRIGLPCIRARRLGSNSWIRSLRVSLSRRPKIPEARLFAAKVLAFVNRRAHNPEVAGSNPSPATNFLKSAAALPMLPSDRK